VNDGGVLAPAGPAAAWIAQLGWVLFIAAALLFGGVLVLLTFALRRRGEAQARRLRPALWIVGGGVLLPVVVLVPLLAYGIAGSARLGAAAPPDALQVHITGHLWWWEVRYRDPAGGADVVLANELRLPVGRTLQIGLSSADVIHSFWVPALAGKADLVPGHVNRIVVRADRPGVFRGPCAEYCGEQHARMALHAVALAPGEFDAWLARQRQPAAEPADALQARGRDAFVAQRCAACHTIRGVAESAQRGPDLTHVGGRLHLGAGSLANGRGALIAWIGDAQHFKPGARMPSYAGRLDAPTLLALAAYLEHLQ
jgi:cytochrome c oxidase subunit II